MIIVTLFWVWLFEANEQSHGQRVKIFKCHFRGDFSKEKTKEGKILVPSIKSASTSKHVDMTFEPFSISNNNSPRDQVSHAPKKLNSRRGKFWILGMIYLFIY